MKTPRVPYSEQVMAQVVVVTGKDKMKSNSLPFTFIPTGMMYHKPPNSPMETLPPPSSSRLSPCYSPQQSPTPVWGDDFFPSTPPVNALEGLLDMCAQQLDKQAEEKILSTAVLPSGTSSFTVDEKELPTGLLPPPCNVTICQQNEDGMLPPTILLPVEASLHQPNIHLELDINSEYN